MASDEPEVLHEQRLTKGRVEVTRIPSTGNILAHYYPYERTDPDWPGFTIDQQTGNLPAGDLKAVLADLRQRNWWK